MKQNLYKFKTQKLIRSGKRMLLIGALITACFSSRAQIIITDFESYTLAPSSAYDPTNTVSSPFLSFNASFEHVYDTAFDYWSAGFAYTNIKDSITGDYTNLYGVRAYNGYTNSATWVVGQNMGTIKTTAAIQTTVNGFYITNTTYAYKSMAKGDFVARKFGDTTGTGSGTTIPQGSYPDYFKVIVKGYNNGALKSDSVTVMLADFTFTNNTQDFILGNWQYVNTSVIGEVDSIKFFMRSSDVGAFGINTPLFFAIDNFSTSDKGFTGIQTKRNNVLQVAAYPNPFNSLVTLDLPADESTLVRVYDLKGALVYSGTFTINENVMDLGTLNTGVYFLELVSGEQKAVKKLIKD